MMLSLCAFGKRIEDYYLTNLFTSKNSDTSSNPLISFSSSWASTKYQYCNTGASVYYLTDDEKKVIWILNMVRANPTLFLESVLLNPKSKYFKNVKKRNAYDLSLLNTLKKAIPNSNFLISDQSAFRSAKCHAISSGVEGYIGHQRIDSSCLSDYFGECCTYGFSDPLSIVMSLLLDYDVPNLSHREICLSKDYSKLGVSIQPHRTYKINAVLDFK